MKIFVGTLYSGENEFDDCDAAIRAQTYQNYNHFVFKHLPNKEAHKTLFQSFLDRREVYELLIKVDADMVICSEFLFENIVTRMNEDQNIDVLAIAVQDFFTGQLINGMNIYRNNVEWDFEKDTMFVDIPKLVPGKFFYDDAELAPAAIHCKNPSMYQAFHYGVHRGLKSIQKQHSTTHWAMLGMVWQNFLRTEDARIGLAVLGAELVYAGYFLEKDVDYTNPKVKNVMAEYQHMDSTQIKREIIKQRWLNWGFLPSDQRRRLLRRKYKTW